MKRHRAEPRKSARPPNAKVCTAFNSIMWIPHGQAGVVRRVCAACDRHRAPTAAPSSIAPPAWPQKPGTAGCRSEEHTSELQSLMRISYAVFCLKKKKKHKTQLNH